MIKFNCPNCTQRISVEESIAGSNGNCPTCNGEINVPTPAKLDRSTKTYEVVGYMSAVVLFLAHFSPIITIESDNFQYKKSFINMTDPYSYISLALTVVIGVLFYKEKTKWMWLILLVLSAWFGLMFYKTLQRIEHFNNKQVEGPFYISNNNQADLSYGWILILIGLCMLITTRPVKK